MAAIFISHSSEDGAQAQALKDVLTKIGFDNVFLNSGIHQGIPLGSDWEKTLYRELDRCHAVLLVLTKNWLGSKWCFAEFAQARALGKTIYVVLENPAGERGEIAKDIQVCDLVTNREGGLLRLHQELESALLLAQGGFAFDEKTRAPYPGLNAFEEADAAVFFGRDQEISAILERVKSERGRAKKALVLLGGSGTGKSSLLKAGALPRLRRERDVDGRPTHLLALQRPGEAPLRALLEALRSLDPTLTLADLSAATSPRAAWALIDRLRMKAGAPQAILVLAIDQAEEMFASDPEERTAFQDLLGALIARDNPARLILSMRADHIEALQRVAGLSDALDFYAVKPMPMERLGEIVKSPAKRVDIEVKDELVEAIRADAATEDALPLVAFVLRELYERYGRKSRRLEKAHYDAMRVDELSPLESAVRRKAEETIAGASEDELDALREAFVPGLVRLDEDSGLFARRDARPEDLPQRARGLIDRLIGARLLVQRAADDGAHVEVAHEALFRVWPKLAGWLAADRDLLVRFQGVQRAAKDWGANARQEAWLAHRGPRLVEAEALGGRPDVVARLDAVELAYLTECRKREDAAIAADAERQREREGEQARQLDDARRLAAAQHKSAQRTRYALIGVVVAAALGLAAAAAVFYAREETLFAREQATALEASRLDARSQAEGQKREAELAALRHAQYLMSVAQQKLHDSNFTLAQLLALEAVKRSSGPDLALQLPAATAALYEAVRNNRETAQLVGHDNAIQAAAFSPDGQRIVTASTDNLWLWDAASGKVIRKFDNGGGPMHTVIRSAEISPDGRTVMSIDVADARLWDIETGHEISHVDARLAWFRPDGSQLAIAGKDGLRVINVATEAAVVTLEGDPLALISAAFSADGERFATSDEHHLVRVWDAATWRLASHFEESGRIVFLAFSADGSRLAGAEENGRYFVRDAMSGAVLADSAEQRLKLPVGCRALSFSADGREVFIAGSDSTADVWDFENGQDVRLRGHKDAVTSGGFSPDGGVVVTASSDGTARLWDPATGAVKAILAGHAKSVTLTRFSLDGARVLTGSLDGTVRVWRVGDPLDERVIVNVGPDVRAAILNADSSRIAVLTEGGVVRLVDMAHGDPIADLDGMWNAMAFDAGGARLALGSNDGRIHVVDAASRRSLADWDAGDDPIDALAFSPDGRLLASGSDVGSLRFWRETDGVWKSVGNALEGSSGIVVAKFDPQGARLAMAKFDGSTAIVDVAETKLLWASRGDGETSRAAAFSPDGAKAFFGGDDRLVRMWDVGSAKMLAVLPHDAPVRDVEYDASKNRVITVTRDGAVRIWRVDQISSGLGSLEISGRTRFDSVASVGVEKGADRYVLVTAAGNIGVSRRFREVDDLVSYAVAHVARSLTKAERAAYALDEPAASAQ